MSANVFVMGRTLRGINECVMDAGATFAGIHHSSKMDKRTPLDLSDLSGAGWREFARQWMLVNRRSAYADGTGFHELWLKAGGSAGHSGVWAVDIAEGVRTASEGREWGVTIETRAQHRKSKKELTGSPATMANAVRVVEYLRSHPDGQTLSRIGEDLGMNNRYVSGSLDFLGDQIETCEVRKGKKQYPGYRLSQTDMCRS
jgi:hypothetical protein